MYSVHVVQNHGIFTVDFFISVKMSKHHILLCNREFKINNFHSDILKKQIGHTKGHPNVCSTRPGQWRAGSTSQSSLNPIPYVCGSQFSLSSNFLYNCLAKCPWHPSLNIVTLAWSSIPLSNVSYIISNNLDVKIVIEIQLHNAHNWCFKF